MITDAYIPPVVHDFTSDSEMVTELIAMRKIADTPEYAAQAFQLADDGELVDITEGLLYSDSDSVQWDSTSEVQDSCTFSYRGSLQWGSDIVVLYQLIRSTRYNAVNGLVPEAWCRFPIGYFIVTTPGYDDLDIADFHQVTGYGKNYLLQNGLTDAYPFAIGDTYLDAITALFIASGALDPAGDLTDICDYPNDWATKTLAQPYNFTAEDTDSYLAGINQLLAASGARNIYVHPATGRWVIEFIPATTPNPPPRWWWAGSAVDSDPYERITEDELKIAAIVQHANRYSGDVYNVPNQWVFIQNGLTFQPIEGSGMYTVNNLGTPPSDQNSVGRVIRSTQYLDATDQADLEKQGDAIVQTELSTAEQFTITSAPWPVGRNFDVFYFAHGALPFDSLRLVQAQQWELPIWGKPMTWTANAIGVGQ